MCGIFCSLSSSDTLNSSFYRQCAELLSSRGPDGVSQVSEKVRNFSTLFVGHTLWTQGPCPCSQPLTGPAGQLLLWNGDIFGGITVPDEECDSKIILLSLASSNACITLSQVIGPYAMIYLDNDKNVWFARDPLGRQSLLWVREENSLLLCSTTNPTPKQNLKELPAFGIFKATPCLSGSIEITLFPWSHLDNDFDQSDLQNVIIGEAVPHHTLDSLRSKFFSHGYPETIDMEHGKEFIPKRDHGEILQAILEKYPVLADLAERVEFYLSEAVKSRIKVPPYCKLCLPLRQPCSHSKVAVLFSGGIDSTLLAILLSRHIQNGESIDLWNVAFDRNSSGNFDTPDRKTALSALEELKTLAPGVNWNFVQIDIPKNEVDKELERRIGGLIYPLITVIDADLGAALWFASIGKGTVNGSLYSSHCRVVLVGMGADEQTGGYRKATAAWKQGSWETLSAELWAGLRNIPSRNLGRDNRVLSDHGLTPRFPFLHEPLIAFLASLPPWQKWFPADGGDKLLFRLVAWKCGLRDSAVAAKRAMQFGCRIAQPKQIASAIAPSLSRFVTTESD